MKKNLGVLPAVFPMPVLMIGTYNEDGSIDVMNAAWGMICGQNKIALFINKAHRTTENILRNKAFTVSIADKSHEKVADYFGIASAKKFADKFERSNFNVMRSPIVNAPIIDEFPVCMECDLAEEVQTDSFYCIVGTIRNTSADERVLTEDGKIDTVKVEALVFDPYQAGYYEVGAKVGQAFSDGKELLK
ncbi:NADH-FMN oxidoreductase RutF, flavin reductase (DIM6/NTAB) family [Acetitomaculum ruminis DSM 5522]|uniref:NADH-FMN oxidoreductase RutF, flavin reductase (DIM6/NTAB) family n=1 Tax=Acetitomaculum ruminis DSM 5522 TaxID=1120918 RepID=A0A1I0WNW2_9FIRM|nr:flavin reductase [Acetitomaculum ruminis]SFA89860.1 NADH-FMN oxidoreductase RutF, flavin reductase (DIM6/NTAB) family [Acetitomaculum ruminis DSM 5522]